MRKTNLTVPAAIRAEVLAMAGRGESYESMSQYMASARLEKILAIRLLADAAHIPLGEAKKTIHDSPAWQFRRANDDEFHTSVHRAAEGWRGARSEVDSKPLKTGTR